MHRYKSAIQAITDPVSFVDRQYTYCFVNKSYSRLYGKLSKYIVGRPVWEVMGRDAFEKVVRQRLDRCFKGATVRFDGWFTFPDGSRGYREESYYPVLDESGAEVLEACILLRDLTNLKEAEEALSISENRFRTVFEKSPFLIAISDMQTGRLVEVNEAFCRELGMQRDGFIGKTTTELGFYSDEDRALFLNTLLEVGSVQGLEMNFQFKAVRYVAKMYASIISLDGKDYALTQFEDVTAQKKVEKALKYKEDKYRSLVEKSNDIIWEYDPSSGSYSFAAGALTKILGYLPEEAKGMTLDDLFGPETKKMVIRTFRQLLESEEQGDVRLEAKHRHKDGHFVWLEILASSVRVDEEKHLYLQGISRDITDRKRAEEELRQKERLNRELIEGTEDLVTVVDPKGNFTYVNHKAIDVFGLPAKECIGRRAFDFIHEEDLQSTKDWFAEIISLQRVHGIFENRQINLRGEIRTISWVANLHYNNQGRIVSISAIGHDVTDRTRVERKLRDRQQRYRGLFDGMMESLALHELVYEKGRPVDYKIVDCNSAFVRLTGIQREQAVGALASELFGTGEAPYLDTYVRVADTGESLSFETYFAPMCKHVSISVFSPYRGAFATLAMDITGSKKAYDELTEALMKIEIRNIEVESLLLGAKSLLERGDFKIVSRGLFNACKNATGATAGYVAMLSHAGDENEVLFLDSGGRECRVNSDLPMPIRGLRAVAYREKRVVMDNNFAESQWMIFMPKGHVRLDNVMFAPLVIAEKVVGIIGLANKASGFTDSDARLAAAFADMAAIALREIRNEEKKVQLINELQSALREIKQLSGLLPICANCKKIRNDEGYWEQIEKYIQEHSNAQFTHGICPECKAKLYPECT